MDIQRPIDKLREKKGLENSQSRVICVCTNRAYLEHRTSVKRQREDSVVKS